MKRCGWILAASALAMFACSSSSDSTGEDQTGDTGGTPGGTGGGAPGTGGTAKKDGGSGGTTVGSGGAKTDSGPGSGGSVAPPTDGGTLALGADGKLTIWTVGDSITNNNGFRDRMCTVLTGQKYKPWFVGSLGTDGGTCNNGRNDGHSGFGIADVLNGKDGSGTVDQWYAGIAKPQVATLMIGTNNIAWWVDANAVMADFADEAISLAEHILGLDPNMYLIVGTIPPESSTIVAAINRDRADLTNEYNAALKEKVPQNALYGKRMFLADTNNGLVWPADSYDQSIHLGPTGNTKVGDTWLSVLTPLLPPP
jgi:hypothetical protein